MEKEIMEHITRKKAGRPAKRPPPTLIWRVERDNPENDITLALISIDIKEDLSQTIEELAARVARDKERPYGETLAVLRELQSKGDLGFYDDKTQQWTRWEAENFAKD